MQTGSYGGNEMEAPIPSFCIECGAANTGQASICFACQKPLIHVESAPVAHFVTAARPAPMLSVAVEQPGPGSLLHERYQLLREIGQGGFGVVYLAEDSRRQHRQVAVKQINIGKLSTRESIDAPASYNREVTILCKLNHSHLPRIYDHFTDPQHWYVVMDYIEGQTLEEYMQATPGNALPLPRVIDIGLQLCEVLDYLHTQFPPIVFRDVKPANIMLTPAGKIYLIDFGIARRFAPNQSRDTGSLGTPGYAAPEQYGTSQTTASTDIYALGATLQTLATGKDPLELSLEETVPTVETRLHKRFFSLVDQMLEKESSKRPKSIQEVSARLKNSQRKKGIFLPPLVKGLLLGIAPYVLVLGMLFLNSSLVTLLMAFYVWPILFVGLFLMGIIMLFDARTRTLGAGILLGMVLGVVLIVCLVVLIVSLWPSGLV